MLNGHLGTSLKFPVQFDGNGNTQLVTGSDNIRQSILEVISTPRGVLFFSPSYGSRVFELQFEPVDEVLESMLHYFIQEAIEEWEPRAAFDDVDFDSQPDQNIVVCQIHYTEVATKRSDSVTFTFVRKN